MSFTLLNIGMMFVALLNLILGAVIYFKNRKGKSNQWYGLTGFFVGFWTFVTAMFKASSQIDNVYFWAGWIYISALLIAWSFLCFSFFFPYKKPSFNQKKCFLLFLPNLLTFALVLMPQGLIVRKILLNPGNNNLLLGPLYPFYYAHFLFYMGWGFFNLFKKYRESVGLLRRQIKHVFLGTVIATSTAAIFSMLFPALFDNFSLVYISHFSTLSLMIFFAYAMAKHYLMNIRLIATELFASLIMLALLMHTVLSASLKEFFIRGTLFLFVSISGILLIRGTVREISQKEKMNVLLEERVKQRTKELEKARMAAEARTREVQKRTKELEEFANLTIGRELKMIELKKKIKQMEQAKK